MLILMVTPECAPVAKVGGLADVVFGLTGELEIRGNSVEIVLPKYDNMRYDHIWGLHVTYHDLGVPWYGGTIRCDVWFGFVHGRKCFFIEPHSTDRFFERGALYGFSDDVLRFAFFSKAALEFILQSGKRPNIIHIHDWQTALVPILLFDMYAGAGLGDTRVCYTIHNFKHQGLTGPQILDATGLGRPEAYYQRDRLQDDHRPEALNLMKGGVVYSNFVTTVSPRYADEVRHTDQGFGLQGVLNFHQAKFGGVLNGLDYTAWNPELDPYLPAPYNTENLDDKYGNKEVLRDRLWLRKDFKPIIAYVGRLDPQKGLHLVRHALFYALERGAQFVLLGTSPDPGIQDQFWQLKHYLDVNEDSHIELGYDEELAHLIYAGSDMVVIPSLYEPCGLIQMIALRYGSVPVARAVGGLANTVFDRDYDGRPPELRNGYVFETPDFPGLESALSRAIGLWHDFPDEFRQLMKNGMATDYSWKDPGQHYLNIYNHILPR